MSHSNYTPWLKKVAVRSKIMDRVKPVGFKVEKETLVSSEENNKAVKPVSNKNWIIELTLNIVLTIIVE